MNSRVLTYIHNIYKYTCDLIRIQGLLINYRCVKFGYNMIRGAFYSTRKFKINNSINTKLSNIDQSSCSNMFSQLIKKKRIYLMILIKYKGQLYNLYYYYRRYLYTKRRWSYRLIARKLCRMNSNSRFNQQKFLSVRLNLSIIY